MTFTALQAALVNEYRGIATAASFGDTRREFLELRSGCGVYDLNWRAKVVLSGNDRMRWLNGMVTNNIRDLTAGRGVYAFLLNPQGHILADLYAYNRGEYLLVDTDQFQIRKLLEVFDHYFIMDHVEVTNSSDQWTARGIAGPKAYQVLSAATKDPLISEQEMDGLRVKDMTWNHDFAYSVVRNDFARVPGYELWLSPEHA